VSSAKFKILFDPKAAKELKSLYKAQPKTGRRIVKLIDSLSVHPSKGKSLKGKLKGCYSLRHRDYRVIYEIYPFKKVIHIIRVGHRKDIYR
jgi:mRNA interferase RelE/StbE